MLRKRDTEYDPDVGIVTLIYIKISIDGGEWRESRRAMSAVGPSRHVALRSLTVAFGAKRKWRYHHSHAPLPAALDDPVPSPYGLGSIHKAIYCSARVFL